MFVTSVTSLKFIQNMTEENDKPKLRLPDWIEVQLNKSKTKCPDCMSPINNYKPKDIVRSIGIRKSSMTERIDSTVLFCEIRCPKCNYDSPVPDPGTAFTVEEWKAWMEWWSDTDEEIDIIDDPVKGIAAMTNRKE